MLFSDLTTDKDGMHYHQCTQCKKVWQHPEPPKGVDHKHHHSCPNCGREEYYKMWLSEVTTVDYPFTGWIMKVATDAVESCATSCRVACMTVRCFLDMLFPD